MHPPWIELDDSNDHIKWKPSRNDSYTGPLGGPKAGPTTYICDIGRNATDLADIWLGIVPKSFYDNISKMTHKYCYVDWVVEREQKDRDGDTKKRKILVPCSKDTEGARHRVRDDTKYRYKITSGYVLAWSAMLLLQGAHFGSTKRTSKKMWRNPPHGLAIPYVRNSMTSMAYEFMRGCIHFVDNDKKKEAGQPGYDPLFKVRTVLELMMSGIQKCWTAGQKITIDESMIRYMGRAITFIQYMPAKPIKHGIKVFAACCAYTGVLLAFKVYCGKENDDSTALEICDQLVKSARLTDARGRILYTDNWYTSVKLAIHMFEKYDWTICGTVNATTKKTPVLHDLPFLKLSNGARNEVGRGWFREAVLKLETASKTTYYVKATSWRDKKQVDFLDSHNISRSTKATVKRHVRGKQTRDVITAPQSQVDYAEHFNGVDRNDRDSADYSTSIRTTRYYLRIFCWAKDRVLHACSVIVRWLADAGIGQEGWKKYQSKNNGRHDFQIDLGIALLNRAISWDWDGKSMQSMPEWMRQGNFLPCDCNQCYFCINKLTSGTCKKREREYIMEYKCGKRARTKGCTTNRVKIRNNVSWCRVCYRKQPNNLASAIKNRTEQLRKLGKYYNYLDEFNQLES